MDVLPRVALPLLVRHPHQPLIPSELLSASSSFVSKHVGCTASVRLCCLHAIALLSRVVYLHVSYVCRIWVYKVGHGDRPLKKEVVLIELNRHSLGQRVAEWIEGSYSRLGHIVETEPFELGMEIGISAIALADGL
ncbi:hypothetical protein Scep_021344 [Stephania cephalantha]|uniref:Uncharacterized protein n=1 Tax=Stephania cephalantha TaxID=152367 RepID=A0AAP0F390_9MAGN